MKGRKFLSEHYFSLIARALMKYDDELPKKHDLSSVKFVACAGDVLNPPAWEWLQKKVFEDRGPIVIVNDIFFVSQLPKTRSGKIMRRLIKAIITDKPLGDYSTIENQTAIEEVKKALKSMPV